MELLNDINSVSKLFDNARSVSVKGDGWRIQVSAAAIKSAFPVFEKMLDGEFKEAGDLVIDMGDEVNAEQAQAFVVLCMAHYGTVVQADAYSC